MFGKLNDRKSAQIILVATVYVVILIAGCKPSPSSSNSPAVSATAATGGRALYESHCRRCHIIGGTPGTPAGPMKAPDLAKVGVDPKHTRDWIIAYIRDPKAQNPDSHMPSFGAKLNDTDIGTLTDYLLSVKQN